MHVQCIKPEGRSQTGIFAILFGIDAGPILPRNARPLPLQDSAQRASFTMQNIAATEVHHGPEADYDQNPLFTGTTPCCSLQPSTVHVSIDMPHTPNGDNPEHCRHLIMGRRDCKAGVRHVGCITPACCFSAAKTSFKRRRSAAALLRLFRLLDFLHMTLEKTHRCQQTSICAMYAT
jgi:hypothetical protein